VADFGVAALLNMVFVYRYVGFSLNLKDTFKTVLASGVMGGVVLLCYDAIMSHTLHNSISALGAIAVGGGVFGIIILMVGGIEAHDIEQIPRVGRKLAAVLTKIRLLRR
jgi:stage V sporulation protein B